MEIDFPALIKDLKDDILDLARKTLTDRVKDVQDDSEYMFELCKLRFERWTSQLKEGTLSKDDFEYNIKSQKDLLHLTALKQAGISKVKVDKFREDAFTIISSGLLKAVGL